MKKFVFLLVNEEGKTVVIYSNQDVAKKMKPVIEEKLDVSLELVKHQVDPDIKVIGL